MRIFPVLALGAAVVGGALVSSAQPKPVSAQRAVCSWGSDNLCEKHETCTERAWNIGLKTLTFGIGPCVSKVTRSLYYIKAGDGKTGSNAPKKDKTEDKDAGEDSGEGSAA